VVAEVSNIVTIIINVLRQGNRDLAFTLIQHALPFQLCQYDQYGQTALHLAVQKNYLEIVKILIEKGANINALASDLSYTHMTPLHYAALTGNLGAVKILLAWGANPHLENGRLYTASTIAYQHGFVDVARYIENFDAKKAKFLWPQVKTNSPGEKQVRQGLSRRILELQNSTIEALQARAWVAEHSKPANNIIDFAEYKRNRQKKSR
jgi:hypothetical protein